MTEPVESERLRLDSWKAIAAYLGRDQATVRRWERTAGLPVRRVAGARGASVFAYVNEIEAWLKRADAAEPQPASAAGQWEPAAQVAPAWRRSLKWQLSVLAGLAVVVAVTWPMNFFAAPTTIAQVRWSKAGVTALSATGREIWQFPFAAGEEVGLTFARYPPAEILLTSPPSVLAAISHSARVADGRVSGGQLFWLSAKGGLTRSLEFDDELKFRGRAAGGPWAISDFRIAPGPGPLRIAVAVRDYLQWPGFVAVIDDEGRRLGTFVNSGWVEQVLWLSRDRLLISGFSNHPDGGMVALLDPRALAGHSPEDPASAFECLSCPPGRPIRYAVLPRSPLNQATKSPFNRAVMRRIGGRVEVETIEVPSTAGTGVATVIYVFDDNLTLLSTSYSDRYRDLARAPHTIAPVRIWDAADGWRSVHAK